MDHLWESHSRRLSEAGLRRGSDTSVILTEDTDSFIIGDRVWVGGTKPGSIAYIGETQFAPGDWAGVVLDEPIGKNDGSVAGCRYFQCEPKRGIFSRLTKLTRQPLDPTAASSPHQKTPTTPPDSARGSLNKSMSPSLNTSTTSLSSTMSQRDLRIGDRVIVSSTQGSKTGVLRYMGTTEFAAGEWCGIELDDPIGKNDGSVGEKRYFECKPKYGLFAPMHKISRSPTSKRSSCVVHKPTGASLNSTLKRTGSRESLVSISSIASTTASAAASARGVAGSTTAREILKEKQHEIEFLRKERDLERERVTKAASQADQAEQSAISIKQDYEKYREEMQKTVQSAEAALTKLLEEKNVLASQLEEERRKCEDLLFRFEEESVNKDDIQKERTEQNVLNTVNENKIKELEKQLTEERERVVQLERDTIKLFETEEELTRLRNEMSNISIKDNIEFQELQSENQSLKEVKASLEKQVYEQTVLVEQCAGHIKELELKLDEKQKENMLQKGLESNIQKDLEQVKYALNEKCTILESMKQEYEKNIEIMKQELQQAQETIKNISQASVTENESLVSRYQKIVDEKDDLLKKKTQEIEIEAKKQFELQNIALENLKAENMKHMNKLSQTFKEQLDMKDARIEEVSSKLNEKISETEKLLLELANQQNLCKKKDEELQAALQKLDELNIKLKSAEENNITLSNKIQDFQSKAQDTMKIIQEKQKLEEDVASLLSSTTNSSVQLNKLQEVLREKDKELAELRNITAAQIEELTKHFQQQVDDKSKYIDEISADISHKSLMLSKLEKEITDLKAVISRKDEEIKNLLEKTSELQDALTFSEQTKTNLESELKVFESSISNLTQQIARADEKISQITTQKEKLESDIANLISTSAGSSEQLLKYNDDLRKKEKELDEVREKAFQTESMLTQTEGKLKNVVEELNENTLLVQQLQLDITKYKDQLNEERKINQEFCTKVEQHEINEKEFLQTISESKKIEKYLEEQTVKVADLENKLKESNNNNLKLQEQCETLKNTCTSESTLFKTQINDLKTELVKSQEEVKLLQKQKVKLESDQSANRWSLEELTDKFDIEIKERLRLESLLSEADSKLKQMTTELLEMQEEKEATFITNESANKDFKDSINLLTNEIEVLKNKLTDATQKVHEKENLLIEMEMKVKTTETQICELNSIITSMKEIEICSSDKFKNTQESLIVKQEEAQRLMDEKNSLDNIVRSLENQLKSQQIEIDTKNNMLKEMQENIEELKKSKEEYTELLKIQNTLENEIKSKQTELEASVKRNTDLEETRIMLQDVINKHNADLSAKEEIINALKAQLKSFQDIQVERTKAEQQSKNEEIKIMQNKIDEANNQNKGLLHAKDYLEKMVKDQQTKIEMLTNTVKNKEKEAEKNMQNLLEKLNVVTSESAQLKEIQSRLEKENKQISAKWAEATNQLKLSNENMKNNYDVASGDIKQHIVNKDIDFEKLQEENETAKNQIDFLNSVIVDMQRKNEALLCKVEVLEMGVPPNEADDYSRSTLDKRMVAPRMFCDICDEFDLHETEDCPRQAQDFLESDRVSKSPKKHSVERPYCEKCEMFGHDTHNCDDAETF